MKVFETVMKLFSEQLYPCQNSGPCNSVNYLGHSKMLADDDDDDHDVA